MAVAKKAKTTRKRTPIKRKKCPSCHADLPITDFYVSKSPLYSLDGKVPICKTCCIAESLNDEGEVDEEKFKSLLRMIDKPYYRDIVVSSANQVAASDPYLTEEGLKYRGEDIVRLYFKNINSLSQLNSKTYVDSENAGFVRDSLSPLKTQPKFTIGEPEPDTSRDDIKLTKKDKQNMKYVLSTIGYDPFEELNLSEFDRRYCFNVMSGYCAMDGIAEDGHKMQSVIEMTLLQCQCRRINELLNKELINPCLEEKRIKTLTDTKSSLLSSISSIAKDNNIASNYNKNSKQGLNSLSSKMKEMRENGYKEIEVNLFDIKTAEAFKQIERISLENISNQVMLDNNDYAEIVKEQLERITEFQARVEELREENRNLKNELIFYKKARR